MAEESVEFVQVGWVIPYVAVSYYIWFAHNVREEEEEEEDDTTRIQARVLSAIDLHSVARRLSILLVGCLASYRCCTAKASRGPLLVVSGMRNGGFGLNQKQFVRCSIRKWQIQITFDSISRESVQSQIVRCFQFVWLTELLVGYTQLKLCTWTSLCLSSPRYLRNSKLYEYLSSHAMLLLCLIRCCQCQSQGVCPHEKEDQDESLGTDNVVIHLFWMKTCRLLMICHYSSSICHSHCWTEFLPTCSLLFTSPLDWLVVTEFAFILSTYTPRSYTVEWWWGWWGSKATRESKTSRRRANDPN